MKMTKERAESLGMTLDSNGNWTVSVRAGARRTMLDESGGSNRGMARHVHEADRRRTPAQNRADIISSAIATGLSVEEATHFYEQGHRG